MNTISKLRVNGITHPVNALYLLCFSNALQGALSPRANAGETPKPTTVQVSLSEWKVSLTPTAVPPGPVVLEVTNSGKVPHALEIEGRGIEKSTSRIMPGASATLTVDLRGGTYEVYCPVGKGSHRMLGMTNRLSVGDARRVSEENDQGEMHGATHGEGQEMEADAVGGAKAMKVVGGGPVIQILPGPFPFADSAMVVIRDR